MEKNEIKLTVEKYKKDKVQYTYVSGKNLATQITSTNMDQTDAEVLLDTAAMLLKKAAQCLSDTPQEGGGEAKKKEMDIAEKNMKMFIGKVTQVNKVKTPDWENIWQ